jgi:hypothetical protein
MEPQNSEKHSLGKIALYPKSLLNVLQYQNKSHNTLEGKTKLISSDFTLALPCIVIYFFLNNQPDARIIQDVPSWLCLETVIKNLHETNQCRMYSRELLMMGRGDARNM